MPPKKRAGSGKKLNHHQNRDASQPSKFGIQHFFDLHSQSQRALSQNKPTENRNPSNDGNEKLQTAPKPDEVDARKILHHVPDSSLLNKGSSSENTSSDAKKENAEGRENQPELEVSPEPTKSVSVKRLKFSPGMLIKQSQDDVVDEVIWKVSPVNDRLQAISKHVPGRIRVLTETSRFNSENFQRCSQNNVQTSPLRSVKLEKWLASPPPPKAGNKPLISSDLVAVKKLDIYRDVNSLGNHGNDDLNDKSEVLGPQTPFTTPPSLTCCNGKQSPDDPRQHKKALIELLDKVEDVIWDEDSSVKDNKTLLVDAKRREIVDLAENPITRENGDFKCSRGTDCNFLVLEVSEKHGLDESSGPRSSCKVLRLLDEQSGEERVVHLWDEWYFSVVAPGDIVGVIGEFDSKGNCDVNRERNFIIVHPDSFLSGTRVSSSFSCPRRAVLDERLKQNEYSVAALMGTLLHQIFQAGLIRKSPTKEFLEGHIGKVIEKSVESLYACGVNERDVRKTLTEAIPKMLKWISSYRYSQASASPSIDFKCDDGLKEIKVSEVIDIEEMVWAPRYGLKGMIDASVQVVIKNTGSAETSEIIMPLEFKTGKGTSGQVAMEHNAQVMLYTLLMSERYMMNIEYGLLYYHHTDQTQGISVKRSDLIGLIMRRNELASDLLKALTMQQLPAMLQSPNMCTNCRHLSVCAIYHKAYGGTTAGSGLGDVYDSLTCHLNGTHAGFLKKWERLIDLEAKHVQKDRWSDISKNDHQPHSLSSLVLDASRKPSENRKARGNQIVYHFKHLGCPSSLSSSEELHEGAMSSTSLNPMLRSGDYVMLSTEPGQQRVANGVVVEIGNSHISVSFGKHLRLPGRRSGSTAEALHQQSWRIEKDETITSFAIMRYNLIQMFLHDENSSRMRKMVVDLKAPRFDSGCIYSQDPSISYVQSEKSLNDDQKRAIIKILTAKDYALILGMPGTGKTSTMVHAVKALLLRDASILLTSYTNSAVDNLLIKLKAQGIDFIRIGRSEVVHEKVRENCLSATKIDDIQKKLSEIKVVAVTCLGITSPLLTKRSFDICIMDEAGQIALPISLGPLMFASKFVLVGDHYQLPPLVQSPEAKENGMSVSLFCRLSEAHPHAISALHCQYRMCAAIMELSNCLIYGNRLCCGSSEIENAKLKYKDSPSAPSWLMEVLDPNQPVIFLNTDFLPAYESSDRRALNNPLEAYITAEVTKALVVWGIEGQDIGIITPYNAQVKLIQGIVSKSAEVNTIDKYQGRDKDCILVSFVRSCENPMNNNISSLLGDWHRINVALTRAKKKLIMIGSCRTLSRVPLLKLLIEKVEELNGMLVVSTKDINCNDVELKNRTTHNMM